ncbi:MAG: hypothetical protein PHS38_09555 [Bacteroidales bacterium]|nr:hypothetical protein [Bacteroidales bacterium]
MIIAFVPCRLKSNRLPFKAIKEINGIASIERCLINTRSIPGVDKVILATSTNREDDILENYNLNGKVEVVRGPEDDVLERFIPSINKYNPNHVIRVTGDSPLVSIELGEYLINSHIKINKDITFTLSKVALGIGCEIYKTSAILKLKELKPITNFSEYLIYYFLNNPNIFTLNSIEAPEEFLKPWRLTLDEENDLYLLNEIFTNLKKGEEPVSFNEVCDFFKENPEAVSINSNNIVKYKDNKELIDFLNKGTTI